MFVVCYWLIAYLIICLRFSCGGLEHVNITNMEYITRRSYSEAVRGDLLELRGLISNNGLQFKHYAINGDGNCYFRSVAVWMYGGECYHARVRKEIVEYVVLAWDRLQEDVQMCYPQCKSKDEYVRFMGRNSEYAGQLESVAAAQLYQRPICIYNVSSNSFIVERASVEAGNPILLWFSFHEKHYEVLMECNGQHNLVLNTVLEDRDESVVVEKVFTRAFGEVEVAESDVISSAKSSSVDSKLTNCLSSLPRGTATLDSIEPDVAEETPYASVTNDPESSDGLRAKKHTALDNEDILFCYLWAKQKSKLLHGGYIKYMCQKWAEKRPDKVLSKRH